MSAFSYMQAMRPASFIANTNGVVGQSTFTISTTTTPILFFYIDPGFNGNPTLTDWCFTAFGHVISGTSAALSVNYKLWIKPRGVSTWTQLESRVVTNTSLTVQTGLSFSGYSTSSSYSVPALLRVTMASTRATVRQFKMAIKEDSTTYWLTGGYHVVGNTTP